MNYSQLGTTKLFVSKISLGTVSLGIDYGINVPGEYGHPEEIEAINILKKAADNGINLFDTAPGYGMSERFLGDALGDRSDCYFATKVPIPSISDGNLLKGKKFNDFINTSLNTSMKNLQRDFLDIVQIHNATLPVIKDGRITKHLLDAKDTGIIKYIGSSVYTEKEALAIIDTGSFDILQIAYNLLDQRMATSVIPAAEDAGVGIITRSALFKGVLTTKSQWLPMKLLKLKDAAIRAKEDISGSWDKLPEMAIRFCYSTPGISSVLIGVRSESELNDALNIADAEVLPVNLLNSAKKLALNDDYLLNPCNWPIK